MPVKTKHKNGKDEKTTDAPALKVRKPDLFELSHQELRLFEDLEALISSGAGCYATLADGTFLTALKCDRCGAKGVQYLSSETGNIDPVRGDIEGGGHACPIETQAQIGCVGTWLADPEGNLADNLLDQMLQDLDGSQEAMHAKVDRMCAARAWHLGQVDTIAEQEDRLAGRKKAKKAAAQRISDRIKAWMNLRGFASLETRSGLNRISVYPSGREKYVLREGRNMHEVPGAFRRLVPPEPAPPPTFELTPDAIAHAYATDFKDYGETDAERDAVKARLESVVQVVPRPIAIRFS